MSRQSPTITIEPLVLFSILDHSLRRQEGQDRVIGTLLGIRSQDGTELEIKASFAVPHNESAEQVEVDMEYHKSMYALHLRANPREVLVGWYATTPDLNAFSALIQNFYSSQGDGTYPYPAVHLTLDTNPHSGMKVQTYTSSSVGITQERIADSCLFVPIPHEIRYSDNDRSGMDAITAAKDSSKRSTTIASDLDSLRSSIAETLAMVERVQKYVDAAKSNPSDPSKANLAVGRFLMDALSVRPSLDSEAIEKMFNSHLQDVLMISYLARTVREQMQISSQLQILTQ